MRSWLTYLTVVSLLTACITLLLWTGAPITPPDATHYTSPLPQNITLRSNNQVRLLDFWQPIIEKTLGSEGPVPNITARSILMYDMTTDKAVYERNPEERMPMASLTKIMTAIISLENPKYDDKYLVHGDDLVGEDSMGLSNGEILSQEELLYGLFLNSGNDAAEVIAHNYPGGKTAFVRAMNDKAAALGLSDTHFSNPSGLQGDGVQYTTAYDLLVITKYALGFPLLRTVAATYQHDIPATATHKEYFLTNETNLISTYPGVKGLKTGYTPEAGMCLITYLEYDGHKIIGIILNSEDRRQEMKDLLDYSLKQLGSTPPAHE